MARASSLFWIATLFAGCNAVLGISDDPVVQSAATQCLRNSDCAANKVCLFQVCSDPCQQDRDCADAQRCLQAQTGTACVSNTAANCDSSSDCPEGTACEDGSCRNACSSDSQCLGDQDCASDGVCRGTDLDHDPPPEGGGGAPGGGGGGSGEGGDAGGGNESCEPNAQACQAGGVAICGEDGLWSEPAACPFVCIAGECGGECAPDTKRCSMGRAQTCSADGFWGEGEDCPVLCDQGVCAESCSENSKNCDDLVPQVCVGGAWQDGEPCDYLCTGGECTGNCTPNDKQCSDGDRQTCGATGAWETDFTCPFVCVGEECSGECVPDTFDCVDGNNYHVCGEAGSYGATESCGQMACYMDECVGGCVPDDVKCVAGNMVQACQDDGTWVDVTTCGSQICRDGACENNNSFSIGISDLSSTYNISSGSIYLVPVHSDVYADLLYFGFGRATKATTNARLTLYSDGNSDGKPDTRVAYSSSNLNFGSSGNAEVTPTPLAAKVNADTDYWIGVEVDQASSPVYGHSQSGAPAAYQYGNTFASGPPSSLVVDDLIDLTNVELNLYLVVKEIPE
jgi:hypothetical protein